MIPPGFGPHVWFIGERLVHFSHQHAAAAFALFDEQKTETIWWIGLTRRGNLYITFHYARPIIIELLPSDGAVRSIITINNRGNEWCAFEAAGWARKKCEAWNKTYLRRSVIKVIIDWYVYTYYGVVTIATHRVMRRPGPVLLLRGAVSPMRWMRLNVVNYITQGRNPRTIITHATDEDPLMQRWQLILLTRLLPRVTNTFFSFVLSFCQLQNNE